MSSHTAIHLFDFGELCYFRLASKVKKAYPHAHHSFAITPAPALEIPSECDIIIKYPKYSSRYCHGSPRQMHVCWNNEFHVHRAILARVTVLVICPAKTFNFYVSNYEGINF
jgi:hypothetical protein